MAGGVNLQKRKTPMSLSVAPKKKAAPVDEGVPTPHKLKVLSAKTEVKKAGKQFTDRIPPESSSASKPNKFAATGPIAKAKDLYRSTPFNVDVLRIKGGKPGMPKATGAESVSSSPSLSKGSSKPPAYTPAGTSEKRVGGKVTSTTAPRPQRPQTRTQRDGLAMDSRKKK